VECDWRMSVLSEALRNLPPIGDWSSRNSHTSNDSSRCDECAMIHAHTQKQLPTLCSDLFYQPMGCGAVITVPAILLQLCNVGYAAVSFRSIRRKRMNPRSLNLAASYGIDFGSRGLKGQCHKRLSAWLFLWRLRNALYWNSPDGETRPYAADLVPWFLLEFGTIYLLTYLFTYLVTYLLKLLWMGVPVYIMTSGSRLVCMSLLTMTEKRSTPAGSQRPQNFWDPHLHPYGMSHCNQILDNDQVRKIVRVHHAHARPW